MTRPILLLLLLLAAVGCAAADAGHDGLAAAKAHQWEQKRYNN